jgi:hypothetical protein
VLTLVGTPRGPESCAIDDSEDGSEVSSYERVTGGRFGLGSDGIKD